MAVNASSDAETRAYLTFALAGEAYAIDVHDVDQVVQLGPVRRVPDAPAHVRGLMDFGGGVIPVLDLRSKLGIDAEKPQVSPCVVVVCARDERVGLVVDTVCDVVNWCPVDIEDISPIGGGRELRSVLGIAKANDQVHLLLDVDGLAAGEDGAPARSGGQGT